MAPQINTAFEFSNQAGLTTEEAEIQYKKMEYIAHSRVWMPPRAILFMTKKHAKSLVA